MLRTSKFAAAIAVVCRSNQNRSLTAHAKLKSLGYNVMSFGTGPVCVLPAPDNGTFKFKFGTPYREIMAGLPADDRHRNYYTCTGLYNMLERNAAVKLAPERFQECPHEFDLVFTLDTLVFTDTLRYFLTRRPVSGNICYVLNLNVLDTMEYAEKGALVLVEFLRLLEIDSNWKNNIDKIVARFNNKSEWKMSLSVQVY